MRVGLAAMGGGMLHLPALIGVKRAMELLLTARRLTAQEALALGLINRVVSVGQARDAAIALADEVLTASPVAVRATKAVVTRAMQRPVEEAMLAHLDYPEVVTMMRSEDAKEGPRAFAEKRQPQWTGR